MSDSFAAQPGTLVLRFDPDDPDNPFTFPVIGWSRGLSGYDPITVNPEDGRMEHGKAVVVPTPAGEAVIDVTHRITYGDMASWIEALRGTKPVARPHPKTGLRFRTDLFIQFGKKSYVNKSFWHFKTALDEFLFEIEGGEEAPEDARVQKINRDTFFRARKLLEVVPFDQLFNVSGAATAAPEDDDEDLI